MNKLFKKISALFLALTMVVTFSVAGIAAEEGKTVPTANDTKTVTITNVEAGATVTAYQITKGVYNDYGFVKYVKADGKLAITDVLAPTSDEVTTIAKNVTGLTSKTLTYNEEAKSFTAALNPGYWVVLVTGSNSKVYNPMLMGVYYSESGSDNTMAAGSVDANTNWELTTKNAFAKSSEVTTEKTIVNPGSGNNKGDDVAFGDTVTFQIKTTIPSYSKEYTHATFIIHDTMSAGLTYKGTDNVKVTIDGTDYADAVIAQDGQNMTVQIPSDYVLENGNKEVIVTYTATLNENAGINFVPNKNTAYTEYTNQPTETSDADKKTNDTPDSVTYHYTFGIDAALNGNSDEVTEEIFKIDEEGNVVVSEDKKVTVTSPLVGAEFKLTNNTTKKVYTTTSDSKGALSFTGLDAGIYTLQETKAPAGYTLDYKKITVVISAEYNEDGTLKNYTITIDGKSTSTYTATYDGESKVTTVDKTAIGSVGIKNTKVSALPSTGGMGTYIFTIAGVCIMILAAGLYVVNRKKKANN